MTQVYLAGAEVEKLTRSLLDNGCKHILYSFWFIFTMRRASFIAKIQDEYKDVRFILDSGAFSYMQQSRRGENQMDWRIYKRHYFEYIGGTWDKWSRIAELDLDVAVETITLNGLDEWRDQMFAIAPKAPVMPVWNLSRGTEEWMEYVKDPRIRCIAMSSQKGADMGYLRRLVMIAHAAGKPVHGMGATGLRGELQTIPYDTVDSTSWLAGQQFGTLYCYDRGNFTVIPKKDLLQLGKAKPLERYRRTPGMEPGKYEVTPLTSPQDGDDADTLLRKEAMVAALEEENERRSEMTARYADMRKGTQRRALRSYYKRIGCDPDLIFDEAKLSRERGMGIDDVYREKCIGEVRKANIIAWVKLGDWLSKLRRSQGKVVSDDLLGPARPASVP